MRRILMVTAAVCASAIGCISQKSDDGGYHSYKRRLAIHDLATSKIVWEGVQTKVML